ncbi:MAG: hypothetical protein LBJ10_10415 [Clostridiales bacterium]|nr:hypothetical protein [Clostridiales bacterium]
MGNGRAGTAGRHWNSKAGMGNGRADTGNGGVGTENGKTGMGNSKAGMENGKTGMENGGAGYSGRTRQAGSGRARGARALPRQAA